MSVFEIKAPPFSKKGNPLCRHCRKTLPKAYNGQRGYAGENLFCSLRCGLSWAISVIDVLENQGHVLVDVVRNPATYKALEAAAEHHARSRAEKGGRGRDT